MKRTIIETDSAPVIDTSDSAAIKLQRLLHSVKASGLQSTAGIADELPKQPDLFVKNYGYVPLPLTERSAEDLLKLCKPERCGKDIVDSSVKGRYQIEPDEFEVRNSKWKDDIRHLVDRVGIELGWNGDIEPKIKKILLYKTGGHFKKHQETEKEKNMFATLILQLPSIYQGGEFVCYHRDGASQVYKLGNDCAKADSSVNFVAHNADVELEVKEVKSGYRFALVYSLCWVDDDEKKDPKSAASTSLVQCLSSLNDHSSVYAVIMNDQFIENSGVLPYENARYILLKNANSMLPADKQFQFFTIFAKFKIEVYNTRRPGDLDFDRRKRSGSSDDEYLNDYGKRINVFSDWTDNYRRQSFDEVYSMNDDEDDDEDDDDFPYKFDANSFKKVINPSDMKQPFVDLKDKKSWGGKEVKIEIIEEPVKTTKYRQCLLVLWPRQINFKSLLKFLSLQSCVEKIYDAIISNDPSEISRDHVNKLEIIVEHLENLNNESGSWHQLKNLEDVEPIFEMCHKLDRLDLIEKMLPHLDVNINLMESLIEKFTWSRIKKSLAHFLLPVSMGKIVLSCKLTKSLHESYGKETAFECFKFAVAPILDDPKQFIKNDDRWKSSIVSKWIQLAKTIVLFPDTKAEHLKKFNNCFDEVQQEELKEVIDELVRTFNKKDLPCFTKLFKTRLRFLEENMKTEWDKFSWKMPGSINGHPKLDAFLRSDTQQTIIYKGEFSGIPDARKFQSQFNGFKKGYSISISLGEGTGKNAQVTIDKTRDYYDSQVKLITPYRNEHAKLKALLANED